MFSAQQKQLIIQAAPQTLTIAAIDKLCHQQAPIAELSDEQLIEFLTLANQMYRAGQQIISDADYDFIFLPELQRRQPEHPFLAQVEPEKAFSGKTVKLPAPMLSTEKAYSKEEIQRWLERIKKAAGEINIPFEQLTFRATPKLDGFAAYDDGQHLYTRGDGKRGTDISRVMQRGLSIANGGARGLGAGEIVVSTSYFSQHLAEFYENSRNFQASVVKEKELEPQAAQAIADHAAVFFPFCLLPAWQGSAQQLAQQLDDIVANQLHAVDYDVDGVVIEVTNSELKTYLGATRHHHRWQIALKNNLESAAVTVIQVHPQTSRSGRVNPVVEIAPTRLSGAMIQRATAHHYGLVKSNNIGPDAIIELTRSGEVIPKIVQVIKPSTAQIPAACPSCGGELIWDGDYLYCTNNSECPAQISHTIEHFFRTLGNNDGFGPATIEKLYAYNIRSVPAVYQLNTSAFEQAGFGPKQSENLVEQLQRSRAEQIEDWRFLAAFGIFRMGGGNCERLLQHYPLEEIFSLTVEQIIAIEGFAEKTAQVVVKELRRIRPLFDQLYQLEFNLERSLLTSELQTSGKLSPIAGKLLVFSGTMSHASRTEMQAQAKKLGAKIGTSVSGKTDYLVIGDKVGVSKINAAQAKGIEILTEQQYRHLLGVED
ncbi:MAG: helix-hairpin-helix domain-containing protein [Desulfuromonas sp.]|nr:helix-hairpin-helix domain-containing protein [Desulfuromonas sp.]